MASFSSPWPLGFAIVSRICPNRRWPDRNSFRFSISARAVRALLYQPMPPLTFYLTQRDPFCRSNFLVRKVIVLE